MPPVDAKKILVTFVCALVSCEICNSRIQEKYRGSQVYLIEAYDRLCK